MGARRACLALLLSGWCGAVAPAPATSPAPLGPAPEEAILALDPEDISGEQVRTVLAKAPAPRLLAFKGTLIGVSMDSFGEFLVQMGYPAERLRNPQDGSYTYSVFEDSREVAGSLAWYFERDGMVPMLVGHSGGGVVVSRVLYDLADAEVKKIRVWNPVRNAAEPRTTVRDPITGRERRLSELRVPWATMFATGFLLRVFQPTDAKRLRRIPDSVEDFTGFLITGDLFEGRFGQTPQTYSAAPNASRPMTVRTIMLPSTTSHIGAFQVDALARDRRAKEWIDAYRPQRGEVPPPSANDLDLTNLRHIAEMWHSIKKHWCLQAQRLIRARRAAATPGA